MESMSAAVLFIPDQSEITHLETADYRGSIINPILYRLYIFSNIIFSTRSILIRCWWCCWACSRREFSNSCWLFRLLPGFIFQIFSPKKRFTQISYFTFTDHRFWITAIEILFSLISSVNAARQTFTVGCDEPKTIECSVSRQKNDPAKKSSEILNTHKYFKYSSFNRERLLWLCYKAHGSYTEYPCPQ